MYALRSLIERGFSRFDKQFSTASAGWNFFQSGGFEGPSRAGAPIPAVESALRNSAVATAGCHSGRKPLGALVGPAFGRRRGAASKGLLRVRARARGLLFNFLSLISGSRSGHRAESRLIQVACSCGTDQSSPPADPIALTAPHSSPLCRDGECLTGHPAAGNVAAHRAGPRLPPDPFGDFTFAIVGPIPCRPSGRPECIPRRRGTAVG